jgi:hypothetical protein
MSLPEDAGIQESFFVSITDPTTHNELTILLSPPPLLNHRGLASPRLPGCHPDAPMRAIPRAILPAAAAVFCDLPDDKGARSSRNTCPYEAPHHTPTVSQPYGVNHVFVPVLHAHRSHPHSLRRCQKRNYFRSPRPSLDRSEKAVVGTRRPHLAVHP